MLGKTKEKFRKITSDFRYALEDEVRELDRQTRIREEESAAAARVAQVPVPAPSPAPEGAVPREPSTEVVPAPAEPREDASLSPRTDSGSSQTPTESVS